MYNYHIETEYDICTSMICGECKQTMESGLYYIGVKINKWCINPNCPKNNNPRHYCHCEHQQTLHEHNGQGVCLVDNCLCDSWFFMCNEEVWNAWNTTTDNDNGDA